MPAPDLATFAQRIYDGLAPLQYAEVDEDYPLANYLGALGVMFQIVEDLGRDQLVDGEFLPGWSQVMDLGRVPDVAVAWLGQFVGVFVTAGLTPTQQRQQVASVGGWKRGTPAAIAAAAQLYLTGTKQVIFRERDSIACPAEPAYGLTVITKTSETPDPTLTEAVIRAAKPAGIVLNYETLPGLDFEELFLTYATMQDVYTSFATFEDVLEG